MILVFFHNNFDPLSSDKTAIFLVGEKHEVFYFFIRKVTVLVNVANRCIICNKVLQ